MSDNIPADLRYTKEHEWAKIDGNKVRVGITAFAVEQLGDITLVDVDVRVGDAIDSGKPFGRVESVKTLSDLFSPLAGKIAAINGDLAAKPELVNEDCYKNWIVEIETSAPADATTLLDASAYAAHVQSST